MKKIFKGLGRLANKASNSIQDNIHAIYPIAKTATVGVFAAGFVFTLLPYMHEAQAINVAEAVETIGQETQLTTEARADILDDVDDVDTLMMNLNRSGDALAETSSEMKRVIEVEGTLIDGPNAATIETTPTRPSTEAYVPPTTTTTTVAPTTTVSPTTTVVPTTTVAPTTTTTTVATTAATTTAAPTTTTTVAPTTTTVATTPAPTTVATTPAPTTTVAPTTTAAQVKSGSPMVYSLSDFMWRGRITWEGKVYTYYSQRVLPGPGLRIPGRHVNNSGYVADGNGYIVLASDYYAKGTVIATPFGYWGKVYDAFGYNKPASHFDVYIR